MPSQTLRDVEDLIEESEFESFLKCRGGSLKSKSTYRSIGGGTARIKFAERWLAHSKAKGR